MFLVKRCGHQVRSLWRRLRRFLGLRHRPSRDEVQPSGLEYPSLEVECLLSELDVLESAATNGRANIPSKDEKSPDGHEARIRQEVIKRVETAKTRASHRVHLLEVSIQTRQLQPAVKRCKEIPASFATEMQVRSSRLKNDHDSVVRALAELEEEIETYKSRYGLTRGPRIADVEDRNNGFARLALFTLVQLIANSVLFGQGSDYGLALGIAIASIFAFFDILLHFNVGELGSRIRAKDLLSRVVGISALVFGAVTVLLVNLSMVHLRLVTRRFGVAGWEEWLPSITSQPFGFTDFLSWGLWAIGLLCSVLAVRIGFSWDEPIPVFRNNGRKIARLKEDRDDLVEEQRTLSEDVMSLFREELDSIGRRAESHVGMISDSVKKIEQIVIEYNSYRSIAPATLDAVVKSYRDANRRHRTEPTPAFFGEPASIEFGDEPITPTEPFKKVVAQAERDHEELRKSLPRARAQLMKLAQRPQKTPGVAAT